MQEKDMTVERYDAARDMIGGLFEELFKPRLNAAWVPAVDIRETAEEVLVYASLPGVEKEDIQLEVKDDALVLSGRRAQPQAQNGEWLRRESAWGFFQRVFSLPVEIKADAVTASHKNGILEIRLPKAEQAKPHKVKIQ